MTRNILWDFRVEGVKRPDGQYRVRITGNRSGISRERVGYNPIWELLRLFADLAETPGECPVTPPTQGGKL